jgi:hypothetical protein
MQAPFSLAPAAADKSIRLAQAPFLLESGDRSITSIATETGFCDVSHLIRAFGEYEGVTPEAYRLWSRAAVTKMQPSATSCGWFGSPCCRSARRRQPCERVPPATAIQQRLPTAAMELWPNLGDAA